MCVDWIHVGQAGFRLTKAEGNFPFPWRTGNFLPVENILCPAEPSETWTKLDWLSSTENLLSIIYQI
jgi:hypothetical protein